VVRHALAGVHGGYIIFPVCGSDLGHGQPGGYGRCWTPGIYKSKLHERYISGQLVRLYEIRY
jgi:hypothetical protein